MKGRSEPLSAVNRRAYAKEREAERFEAQARAARLQAGSIRGNEVADADDAYDRELDAAAGLNVPTMTDVEFRELMGGADTAIEVRSRRSPYGWRGR